MTPEEVFETCMSCDSRGYLIDPWDWDEEMTCPDCNGEGGWWVVKETRDESADKAS